MSISVFKTLWKENLSKSETLLELTSTKNLFKDFVNTLRKINIKAKRFTKFQDGCFSDRTAMFYFICKSRDSDRSKQKGVQLIDVSENNCSKSFINISNSKFVVKLLI